MKKIIQRLALSLIILAPSVLWAGTESLTTTSALRLTVSPGATVYRETDGFQTTFSLMQQHGNVFVGLESAYLRWSPSARTDYKGLPVGQTSIPLLATAFYRFENDSGVYPYLGGSLGMAYTRRDDGLGSPFQTMAFARPGVEFEIAEVVSFTIEPRVGILDGSFLFAPMVGLSISL